MTLTIDVHAHHFPASANLNDDQAPRLVIDEDPRIMLGDSVFRRVRAACFDVAARVTELDAAKVDRQVISPIPITLVQPADPADAGRLLAAQNDGLAEAAEASGDRLVALAGVPLQDPARAVAELDRASGLGMLGVEITTCAAGRELDDPDLDLFWRAASDLDMPVFVHPAHQEGAIRRSGQPIEFGLGMLTDTALAASALVFGGVLDRFPKLRVALAHGCGTFPWAYPRLRYMATLTDAPAGAILDRLVRRLWADTLVFDPAHLPLLVERFGTDHLLFGTDHPFLPEGFDGPRDVLTRAGLATPEAGCLGSNAMRFLGLDGR